MRLNFLSALLIPLAFIACNIATSEDKTSATVAERLQGRWEIVDGIDQGRGLLRNEVADTFVTVSVNEIITYNRDKDKRYQAIFTIDESQVPMQINLTSIPKNSLKEDEAEETLPTEKPISEVVALGILKFEKQDRWVLCYALPGSDRPTKFESPEGSRIMLFTLARPKE